jgi:hypothetical protein
MLASDAGDDGMVAEVVAEVVVAVDLTQPSPSEHSYLVG